MKIIKMTDISLANACDIMLSSLIMEEKKYDNSIRDDLIVHDWYATTLDNDHRITFVAIDGEEVIGFIHGFIKEEESTLNDTIIMLDALYVKEKNRKQGVGTALIEEFKKWAKLVDAKFIDLVVFR